ncbi:MAG: lipoyl synthase [Gammaproteobacteria bacterium]|nr:lipoyl synthase [Gammaproteobacteria bacterium]
MNIKNTMQENQTPQKRKPRWIRSQWPCNPEIAALKKMLRSQKLATVCEEAACPNLGECFGCGTATFMIMGNTCTRNCKFCNVTHGLTSPLDQSEPNSLAETVAAMHLKYVVVTSVTRDDLVDGGAAHFAACIKALRTKVPGVKIEILTPDFKQCQNQALKTLGTALPDVFNHNIETAPRLYATVRPQANYQTSLTLLKIHKELYPEVLTKSGMMLGLGETKDETVNVMLDLRKHNVDMLTLGQYLQPTTAHLPVARYVLPQEFTDFAKIAKDLGFKKVASAPLVRSSYHAEAFDKDSDF